MLSLKFSRATRDVILRWVMSTVGVADDDRERRAERKQRDTIICMSFRCKVYSPDDDRDYPSHALPPSSDGKSKKMLKLSGADSRRASEGIPEWFSCPSWSTSCVRHTRPITRRASCSTSGNRLYFNPDTSSSTVSGTSRFVLCKAP